MNQKYIPHTNSDQEEMLKKIGVAKIDDLFAEIPAEARLTRDYNLPSGKSELEVTRIFNDLNNKNANNQVSFLGAGSYDHYIPSIIKHITSRSEFYTAYTPYQPEVSQGTLQYIFEYQTMITDITGMDVTNASMYDGATAVVEAIAMATSQTKRNKVLVSGTLHPNTIQVIKTYTHFRGFEIVVLNEENGILDVKDLKAKLNDTVAAVVVQNPNFYGSIEDAAGYVKLVHDNESLLIMVVNPLSLAVLKTPGEIGADIACGEAQPLGIPQSFGGPYLGFLCTTKALVRKMPGRIVGQTKDVDGKRAFVLTLQAREQHIRREKANSNICSNQSLNALAATVYMATMGKKGIVEVANQNIQKANYAYQKITALPKFTKVFSSPIFNEFVVKSTVNYDTVKKALMQEGIIAGLHLGEYNEKYRNHILFCVTEKRTKEEIDKLVKVLGGLK